MPLAGASSSGVAAVRYGLCGALVDLFLATMGASSSTVRRGPPAVSPDGSPVTAVTGTSSTEQLGKRRRACTGEGIDALLPKRGDSPGNTSLSGARLEPAVPLENHGPEPDAAVETTRQFRGVSRVPRGGPSWRPRPCGRRRSRTRRSDLRPASRRQPRDSRRPRRAPVPHMGYPKLTARFRAARESTESPTGPPESASAQTR